MRDMTVSEFYEYCMSSGKTNYIYATDNQKGYDFNSVRLSLRFENMSIGTSKNKLLLFNESCKMSLNDIIKIVLYDERPCIGTVFVITYKERHGNEDGYRSATLIME